MNSPSVVRPREALFSCLVPSQVRRATSSHCEQEKNRKRVGAVRFSAFFFFCSSFVFASLVFTQALANTRSKLRASLAFSHTMSLNKRVGFIGAGQMAEALARGFVARGVVTVSAITATDPVAARKEVFKSFGASVTGSNAEVRLRWLLLAIQRKRTSEGTRESAREGREKKH